MTAHFTSRAFFTLLCAFSTPANSQIFQELYHFSSCYWDDNTGWHCPDGAGPKAALIQGRNGYFYGTTTSDGQFGCGTVFRMTPEGQFTTLASFDGTNGCHPFGALVQASDGNFYGTTLSGGGTLFRITPTGAITHLRYLGGMWGVNPMGDLTEGPDHKLYGVTQEGGDPGGMGTIFRISLGGNYERLAVLYPPDTYFPTGGLLLASDGNFYGVSGGDHGSVYKLTTNGVLTTIALFPAGVSAWPYGKMVEARDGSFYGASDGFDLIGAIYKLSRNGMLTSVAHFNFANGEYPVGLIQARDGNFYGLCYSGGTGYIPPQPCGTVFRMTPDGTLTGLFSFTGYGGEYPGVHPWAGLVEGTDGNLYGTTSSGGVIGAGNIFRIIMPGNECSLTCPTNISVCNDPGQCGAVVHFDPPLITNCSGFGLTSAPPSGSFFPVGTNTVVCTAIDSSSGRLTNTCNFLVAVRDCEPPVIHSITANPASLWPPNRKMQPVTLRVSASDNCRVARSKIISVTSNEAGSNHGNLRTASDWEITGDLAVNLRAQPSHDRAARIYTVTVECADAAGNQSTAVVRITVQH
jgi:uncharacterized repeat protein (TIGR03803 family)